MKTYLRLFSLIATMVLPITIWANVIVKGHVTYQNGQPAANYAVHIATDSTNANCSISHVVYTNPNGVYQDTLVCNAKIERVSVWVLDCHNNRISNYLPVPTSGVVEMNYTICLSTTCHAIFSAKADSLQGIYFNAAPSTTATGDNIIKYNWSFGDGTTATTKDPHHVYAKPGNYTVCLVIVSTSGCNDSVCNMVTVMPAQHCHAQFSARPDSLQGIYFNAAPSTTSTGDNIVKYRWSFGDGATATTKDPHHIYTKPGNYIVCLVIVSTSGCTDSVCNTVMVLPPPPHCHAQFTYLPTNIAGSIHFNAAASTGDSVTQYHWNFGDGGTASTIDPYHTYSKAGNYLICLTIVCKNGCTDSTCIYIVVAPPPPTTCSANFNFTDTGLNGHFNSAQISVSNGDSIVSRNWTFGDGQTLTGNVISPLHQYKTGGNYQACLKITTRLGCASEFCKIVHIAGDSLPATPELIKITSVYPNPVTTQFSTVIYSKYNNVDATLAIYDVYGVIKWSVKKVLAQGNTTFTIPTSQLTSGPYIFKVSTIYGVDSKRFFKL